MKNEEGKSCSGCGGSLKRFEHRAPESERKDQLVCFNGLPKSDHICVAECVKVGSICENCRLLQGSDGIDHHPHRSEWTKRNGGYTRKGRGA